MKAANASMFKKQVKVPPRWTHQNESRKFFKGRDRVLDTSDPGTGKTRPHAEDYAEERRAGRAKCCLVLAPKRGLKTAWFDDCALFVPDMKVSIARASNREAAFAVDADIYVTNLDAVTWLAKQPAKFFARFSHLIIDEITAYKHKDSQRSRAIAKIVDYFPVRRGLTGTPNTNGICDVWHPVKLLDDGKRLGSSFYQFRGAVCAPEQVGPRPEHVKWVDKPTAEAAVAFLLKDLVIRHEFEQCMDIPKNHQYPKRFELTPKHRALYAEMERERILELKNKSITAVNAAVLYTKLLQVASGAVYDNEGGFSELATERYELVMDLAQEVKHSVVFFLWQHQKNALIAEAEARGMSFTVIDGSVSEKAGDRSVKDYQAGFYDVVFLHPQSAAHTLTFTRGTRSIWASPTPNLEHFKQGSRRIYRGGQKHRTENIVVIAEDTIDEVAWNACQMKDTRMTLLNDFLAHKRAA